MPSSPDKPALKDELGDVLFGLSPLPGSLLRHFCLIIALAASLASGDISRIHLGLPLSSRERVVMEAATHALVASGMDLPALETLIAGFPSGIFYGMGGNASDSFDDPTHQAAWTALLDWYSIGFLEKALTSGSDDAAWWALKKLSAQALNGPSPSELDNPVAKRLVARDGVVTTEVLRRLIPALERLRTRKSERTSGEASAFIARAGLLVDRQAILASLLETDEATLNATLMHMFDMVRIDPQLTPEIWTILARARTEGLATTCLRYPWLFALPAWDAAKTQLLARFTEKPGGGDAGNADIALRVLARSNNPLAGQILAELAVTNNPLAIRRVTEYQQTHPQSQP